MVSFPPCKINLGLNVLSKRADGYHNIETCFYPVPWTDILEIIAADKPAYTFTGSSIPGKVEDNLCIRAYSVLSKDFEIPPIQLHLHKIIPTGAGLGGGSSDAAATLHTLNEIFSLGISVGRLRSYASQLGSDCPFFIEPRPMLGIGKGEILTSMPVTLTGKFLILVKPLIHISSADAYRAISPRIPQAPLTEILGQPISAWKERLINDFETSVFLAHPTLFDIKQKLYELGAIYASLSGSGSSLFGLFDQEIDSGKNFEGMQSWSGILG